jgi:glycosyltransferase involved in cell wall biosynthesis/phosphoheptose isomerase
MKVAMVSEHASPLAVLGGEDAGGQNVHVAALSEAIARRGARVRIHTRRDDPGLPERMPLAPRVDLHHVDAGPARALPKDDLLPYMDEFAEVLVREWTRDRPDVVHAHFWMSGHASLHAARRLRIPVVQTFHALGVVKRRYQGDHDTSPPERLEIERRVLCGADHVVATCTDEVFELLRMGANGDRLTVVPCGVDLSLFHPNGLAAERRPGTPRIVSVGRLVERKGVGNAISALRWLPGAELVVAGGPAAADLGRDPEVARLRAVAEDAGVADRVDFRGRMTREAVAALLRSADVVVAVPWYEPFGIVPVEAMACGVPVVASAIGGMIDTIVDEVTGVHVPPRDPERLASALRSLLDDPDRRARLGRAGAQRASRLYDWDRIASSTLEVYGRLLGERRLRRRVTGMRRFGAAPDSRDHLAALADALRLLDAECDRLNEWGEDVATRLLAGGRLLAAGNGGSAAEAQHLTAELVGRYSTERRPLSAICLHADTSSLTAITNDYGPEEAFARQVRAHARPGDVLILLSTSGRSPNVLAAAEAANAIGVTTRALTGSGPNPLEEICDDTIALRAPSSATVQELHLVALHVMCAAIDREVALVTDDRVGEAVQ